MCNGFPDMLNELFGGFGFSSNFSESDIISDYIDGKINKEEYIRRMNEFRGKQTKD